MTDKTEQNLDQPVAQEFSATTQSLNIIVQQILQAEANGVRANDLEDYYEERAAAFMGILINLPTDAQIEVEIEVPGATETGTRRRRPTGAEPSYQEIEEREMVLALQFLLPSVGISNTGRAMQGVLRVGKPTMEKPTIGLETPFDSPPVLVVNPAGTTEERENPMLRIPLKFIKPATGIRLTKGKPLTRPPSFPR